MTRLWPVVVMAVVLLALGAVVAVSISTSDRHAVVVAPATTATVVTTSDALATDTSTAATPATNPTAGLVQEWTGLWRSPHVSSQLANNVFYQFWASNSASEPTDSLTAWSAVTKQSYPVSCTVDNTYVTCAVAQTSDPNAQVVFTWAAVNSYTQAQADAYASSPNAGP